MSIAETAVNNEPISPERGAGLVFVTVLANIFLYGFALDAVLSIADDGLKLAINEHGVSFLRNLVAELVILHSLVMALILWFVPHLPRRILLPPIAFAIWAALGAPPLPSPSPTWISLAVAASQLLLVLFSFAQVRNRTDGDLWLSAGLLPHKRFLVLRTVVAAVLLLFISTIATPALFAYSIARVLELQTDGYVDFTGEGIDLQEKVLTKDNKTVHLIGMMHIGEPRFYIDLFSSFPPGALVFAEGVTDREARLGRSFSYSQAAEVVGLAQQPMLEETLSGDDEEGTDAEGEDASKAKTKPDVVRPDVDLSEFNEETITFLKGIAALYSSRDADEAAERLSAVSSLTEDEMKIIMGDILEKRNARLLGEFDKRIDQYDIIYIPWGAMHMPGIEKALKERGFEVSSEQRRQVIRYDVLINAMLQRLRPVEAPTPSGPGSSSPGSSSKERSPD